jgi:hypothetical protein
LSGKTLIKTGEQYKERWNKNKKNKESLGNGDGGQDIVR